MTVTDPNISDNPSDSNGDANLNAMEQMLANLAAKMHEFSAQIESIEPMAQALDKAKHEAAHQFDTEVYEIRQRADAEIARLRMERDERIKSIDAQSNGIKEMLFDARRGLRDIQREYESAQRKLEQQRRLQEQEAQFKALEDRWDLLTAGAPWREWAKEHQLVAGRKMAYQHSMILADVMGLGKTLSAIVACDYIEAATRDATPDNPYVVEFP